MSERAISGFLAVAVLLLLGALAARIVFEPIPTDCICPIENSDAETSP